MAGAGAGRDHSHVLTRPDLVASSLPGGGPSPSCDGSRRILAFCSQVALASPTLGCSGYVTKSSLDFCPSLKKYSAGKV